jgi:hypothetical protein
VQQRIIHESALHQRQRRAQGGTALPELHSLLQELTQRPQAPPLSPRQPPPDHPAAGHGAQAAADLGFEAEWAEEAIVEDGGSDQTLLQGTRQSQRQRLQPQEQPAGHPRALLRSLLQPPGAAVTAAAGTPAASAAGPGVRAPAPARRPWEAAAPSSQPPHKPSTAFKTPQTQPKQRRQQPSHKKPRFSVREGAVDACGDDAQAATALAEALPPRSSERPAPSPAPHSSRRGGLHALLAASPAAGAGMHTPQPLAAMGRRLESPPPPTTTTPQGAAPPAHMLEQLGLTRATPAAASAARRQSAPGHAGQALAALLTTPAAAGRPHGGAAAAAGATPTPPSHLPTQQRPQHRPPQPDRAGDGASEEPTDARALLSRQRDVRKRFLAELPPELAAAPACTPRPARGGAATGTLAARMQVSGVVR